MRNPSSIFEFDVDVLIEKSIKNHKDFVMKVPNDNWSLLQCELFENDIAVFLFETSEGEQFYYRYLIIEVADKECKVLNRFEFNTGMKRVNDIGLTNNSIVFALIGDNEKDLLSFDVDCNGVGNPKIEDLLELNQKYLFIFNENGVLTLSENPPGVVSKSGFSELLMTGFPETYGPKTDSEKNNKDDNDDNFEDDGDGNAISDIKGTRIKSEFGEDALKKLKSLIGLDDVKDKVEEICNYIDYIKFAESYGIKRKTLCYNMVFEGNPGTAKTTVARLVARIFKEKGITSNDCFYEAGRVDLVAKYLGQTAIKVKEVFKKAKGGLLFIDEAYSLTDRDEGSYGDEAIATIVQEMENNRDTVVIFAGYPDKMEKFLSRNPGLRSRVPYRIIFKDYSADELVEITKMEAANLGYSIEKDTIEKIKKICLASMKSEEFGNGRFCRNMVEKAEINHAARIMKSVQERKLSKKTVVTLTADDFEIPCNTSVNTKPLGFCA